MITAVDKSVKFNPETIETSIGGTESAGQINITMSSNVSTDDSSNNNSIFSQDGNSPTGVCYEIIIYLGYVSTQYMFSLTTEMKDVFYGTRYIVYTI